MITVEWTPEHVEILWAMHLEGKSSREIGEVVGRNKNAVIGKIHRERIKRGLSLGAPPKRKRDETVEKRKYVRRIPEPSIANNGVGIILKLPAPVAPIVEGVSIVDVTGCRWPVRDDAEIVGGFAFCDAPQRHGTSYCEYHNQRKKAEYSDTLIRKTIKDVVLRFKSGKAA